MLGGHRCNRVTVSLRFRFDRRPRLPGAQRMSSACRPSAGSSVQNASMPASRQARISAIEPAASQLSGLLPSQRVFGRSSLHDAMPTNAVA